MRASIRPSLPAILCLAVLPSGHQLAGQIQDGLPASPARFSEMVQAMTRDTPGTSEALRARRTLSHKGRHPRASQSSIPSFGGQPDLEVTFRIYNYAQVPPLLLRRAEEQTTRVFSHSGVRAEWVDCPTTSDQLDAYPACRQPLTREDLIMYILPAEKMAKFTAHGNIYGKAEIAGDERCSRYAHIFFGGILDSSLNADVSPEFILGSVMAHEAGHLLLGSNSHSRTGLMQSIWDGSHLQDMARRTPGFADAESRQLRSRLAERIRLDQTDEGNSDSYACTTNSPGSQH